MKVACIGLGLMGSKLASRIAGENHEVSGFDISPDVAVPGVEVVDSAADAVNGAEIVVMSLPTSRDGIDVILKAKGIAGHLSAGAVVVDTTTADPADSELMASSLADRGFGFVDATLSGSIVMAETGDLTVMVGGDEKDVDKATPILSTFANRIFVVGRAGSGARMKLIVNHVLGVHRAVLAESLVVAERGGIDLDVTLDVLRSSAAASKAMELFGQRMVDHDHQQPNSRLRQTLKDARLIVANASRSEASADLAEATLAILEEGAANGLADWDNTAVIEVLRRR